MTTDPTMHNSAGDRNPVFVSEVIGDGPDAHREVRVGDWTLTVPGAEGTEPEIPDDALAARLGLADNDLRSLARRHAAAGNIAPRAYRRTVRRFTKGGRNRGEVTVDGFMFNEADALFLVTRSETPRAVALTREMIAVYMAARRGLLPRPAPAAPPQLAAEVSALRAAVVDLQRELASGTIGPDVALEKIVTPLRRIAALRGATGRDRKAERARYDRRLRNLLGHARRGATWARLDRKLLHVAELHVGEWLDAAIRDARRHPPGQLSLSGVEPPRSN